MKRPSLHPETHELAEATIARTLHGLGHTAAHAGMHDRILRNARLRAAEERAAAPLRSRWPQLLRWAVPVACTAAVVVAVLAHNRVSQTPDLLTRATLAMKLHPSPAITAHRARTRSITQREVTHPAEMRLTAASSAPATTVAANDNPDAPIDYARRAVENTQAPSQPAPPLPLTAQEHQLLHLVQSHDTVELAEVAELDPGIRAQREAFDRDAFDRFFAPPKAVAAAPNPPSTPSSNGGNQ